LIVRAALDPATERGLVTETSLSTPSLVGLEHDHSAVEHHIHHGSRFLPRVSCPCRSLLGEPGAPRSPPLAGGSVTGGCQLASMLKGWISDRSTPRGAVSLLVDPDEVFVDVGQERLVEEIDHGLGAD